MYLNSPISTKSLYEKIANNKIVALSIALNVFFLSYMSFNYSKLSIFNNRRDIAENKLNRNKPTEKQNKDDKPSVDNDFDEFIDLIPHPSKGYTFLPSELASDQFIVSKRTHPSPDRKHVFNIFRYDNSKTDTSLLVYNLVKLDDINLTEVNYNHELGSSINISHAVLTIKPRSENYVKWANNNNVIFEYKSGSILVENTQNDQAQKYDYDSSKMVFINVDKNLSYWLFQSSDPWGVRNISPANYSLFDAKQNLIKVFKVNYYTLRAIQYDHVNNGFIFAGTNLIEKDSHIVTEQIDFLDLNTLEFKNLLTAEPQDLIAQGCRGTEYIYTKGEIKFTPNCFTISSKHISKDGYIHIKL